MRARINIERLSTVQWGWLKANLPETQTFGPDDVRMCVELEIDETIPGRSALVHVEMPPRAFIALIERLSQVEKIASDPITCDHGAKISNISEESPSLFEGQRVVTFQDGCWTTKPFDPDFADGFMHMQNMPAEYDR